MDSRSMYIAFEELLRNTNPELALDTDINTDVAFQFLTRAQEEYISENFLLGDSLLENINAIRKRSDVLRNIIKRSEVTIASAATSKQVDGGYFASISNSDYWMFLSGVLSDSNLSIDNKGSDQTAMELELINHYDLQKKVRTINNEPIFKYIPIVLEGENGFVFYLDKERLAQIGEINVAGIAFEIIYLAHPVDIKLGGSNEPSLPPSTHNDIVKLAVNTFITEYKYRLGIDTTKPNG